jgi:hypothetical protein
MTFLEYLLIQCRVALCSSLALALLTAVALLLVGKVEGSITLDLGFSRSDSLWILLGLPLAVVLLTALVAPLAFLLHRVLFRRGGTPPDRHA